MLPLAAHWLGRSSEALCCQLHAVSAAVRRLDLCAARRDTAEERARSLANVPRCAQARTRGLSASSDAYVFVHQVG